MPHKQVAGRTATPIQPIRGNAVRLTPSGNPYLSRLPGPDRPHVLDLFCGAGGLSLGFALAGFHVAGGIDADKWSMETHAYNFGGHDQPIELSPDCTPEDALHRVGVQRVEVLIGGPPCQGFARVGRGKIRSLVSEQLSPEELEAWDDPRNQLYRAYLKFVELLRPGWLVMENVPDMALHKGGAVEIILRDLSEMGYTVDRFVLNAADYGVPQTRQRLFIIANRHGFPVLPPSPTHLGRHVTLRQAIGDLPAVRPEESADELPYHSRGQSRYVREWMRGWLEGKDRKVVYDHVVRRYAEDDQEAFTYLEEGQRYCDLPSHLQRYRKDVFDDKYHKLIWNKPSWTITAHIAKDGYKYIHPDKEQVRTITAREAARIQSFPDWFRFAGFRTHRLRQIGNAVPPLLARAIAQVIMEQWQANHGA